MRFDKKILLIYLLIVLLAVVLRFYNLDLRPIHHDEGLRGNYILRILKEGIYKYQAGYHGPFLPYVTAVGFQFLGVTNVSLRIMEALFGTGLILLLYSIRTYLGRWGFLTTSALIAVSPSFVYFSRFAIQEPFVLFFTLAIVICAFLYIKSKRNIYLYLGSIFLATLFSVKENAYIVAAIFFFYLLLKFMYSSLRAKGGVKNGFVLNRKLIISELNKNKRTILLCLFLFTCVFIWLYAPFFKNLENLQKAIGKSAIYWIKRTHERHQKLPIYYIEILKTTEPMIFVMGLAGIVCSFIWRKKEFLRFTSYWALMSIAIYFYMPFKEPWLILHLLLPLSILGGLFVTEMIDILRRKAKWALLAFLIFVFSFFGYSAYTCIDINFYNYASKSNKLAYVQSSNDIKKLVKTVGKISVQKTGGKNIDIIVAASEYYPLRWYWRDYPNVKYYFHKSIIDVDNWTGRIYKGDGELSWASDFAKRGSRSIQISSISGADGGWCQENISVRENSHYKLSGWIKTENVANINARKFAQIFVMTGPREVLGETKCVLGTNDWTFMEADFYVPVDTTLVYVVCTLGSWGEARGTIWFDNLSLTQDNKPVSALLNSDFEKGNEMRGLDSSILIVMEQDCPKVDSLLKGKYEKKRYELRPGKKLVAYFKENLLEGL